jgi:hypothetical protein
LAKSRKSKADNIPIQPSTSASQIHAQQKKNMSRSDSSSIQVQNQPLRQQKNQENINISQQSPFGNIPFLNQDQQFNNCNYYGSFCTFSLNIREYKVYRNFCWNFFIYPSIGIDSIGISAK